VSGGLFLYASCLDRRMDSLLTLVSLAHLRSSLPSLDATSSYTPFDSPYNPISPEDLNDESTLIRLLAPTASASAPEGNRGHKLERGARWVRKGKAVAWGMSVGEREVSGIVTSCVLCETTSSRGRMDGTGKREAVRGGRRNANK
jgi:hypothetical protein